MRTLPMLAAAATLMMPSQVLEAQSKTTYEIHAIQYAKLKEFPVAGLVAGADRDRKMDIGMYVWLLKGNNGRTVLFDCGFYREKFIERWHPAEFSRPSDAVARATGIKSDEITDVVISHIHWDHADGFDLFPKAKIWIQKDELAYYSTEAWQPPNRRGAGADSDDVLGLVKLNIEGRVGLVNGDAQEIIPGITAYIGGKHTYQSQYIAVNTAAGAVVLASDNLYLYENLERHVPIAATLDAASNLRAQDRMRQLATNLKFILPGHDPAILKNFPSSGIGAVRIQ